MLSFTHLQTTPKQFKCQGDLPARERLINWPLKLNSDGCWKSYCSCSTKRAEDLWADHASSSTLWSWALTLSHPFTRWPWRKFYYNYSISAFEAPKPFSPKIASAPRGKTPLQANTTHRLYVREGLSEKPLRASPHPAVHSPLSSCPGPPWISTQPTAYHSLSNNSLRQNLQYTTFFKFKLGNLHQLKNK